MAGKKVNNSPPKKKKTEAKAFDPQKALQREVKAEPIKKMSRDEVIKTYTPLVQTIVANIVSAGKVPPNLHFNDLLNYGIEGLAKAWENFDTGRGVQFKVYASYRVRGEILDRIRKEWKYKNPGAYKSIYGKTDKNVAQAVLDSKKNLTATDEEDKVREIVANSAMAYLLSFEDTVNSDSPPVGAGDPSDDVIEQIEFARERRVLWDAVRTLTEDEKKIIKCYYIEDKTQNDISRELGYSKSKISRMHASVLNKLKMRLQRRLDNKL
jgi:RNA polymerase sigma factor for flagellar operon FliA